MFIEAFRYKSWADERTLTAIESIDKARYNDSYAFTLQQINHMVIVEELFRSRLIGSPPPHNATNTVVVPTYEKLRTRLTSSVSWYLDFIGKLDNAEMNRNIAFIFADGKSGSMTVKEILFHIINHGSYHRGSIAHALDLARIPHPADGYGIFIHEIEPQRRKSIV
ncbi:MAG: DinB family protein [Granulosicoccus sp.]|nr:DinB family protein [Granulosicoccus sp.]